MHGGGNGRPDRIPEDRILERALHDLEPSVHVHDRDNLGAELSPLGECRLQAEPEGLDFEGLNSINVLRQPQIRWVPRFGPARRWLVAAGWWGRPPAIRGP